MRQKDRKDDRECCHEDQLDEGAFPQQGSVHDASYTASAVSALTKRIQLAFFAVLFMSLTVVALAPATPRKPVDQGQIKTAKVSQAGESIIIQVRTKKQVALSKLHRYPLLDRKKAKYLCAQFTRLGHKGISSICLGGKRSHHIVSLSRLKPNGDVVSKKTVQATVKRSGSRKLVFKFIPADARLVPAQYDWRAIYSDGTCPTKATSCGSSFPATGTSRYRVLPVKPVGCTSGGTGLFTNGSRKHRRVALTFDDGPSLYTDDVLKILKDTKVTATFFEIGNNVNTYPEKTRKILALGHEIGNHTTNHGFYPSASDIANASHDIKRASGFTPCDFRPPGGSVNSAVIANAAASGMSTINWDVDTNDWQLPGSATITARVLGNVNPGSIVLMHDGGGPRQGTVDSLRATIHGLKKRGYSFVTVSDMLGGGMRYRPVR